ncbi:MULTISPECIES: hypothetical protein [unclassified Streptomyces]|uniref:hypothetical protein n=1 Tax=unclassified Streptomyces TaxID=2593676 RepID=UPI000372301E|nr:MULTISPECIES: hypothetical protein [unclassified Streptomyces]
MALAAFNPLVEKGSCTRPGVGRDREPVRRAGGAHRWTGRVLIAAGLALLPWLGYLAGTLPPAEAAAWVALDTLEAAALLTAGTRLLRSDPRHRAPAAVAAALLLADACIDLATAAPGPELAAATAMALAAELPLTALCVGLAVRRGGCAVGVRAALFWVLGVLGVLGPPQLFRGSGCCHRPPQPCRLRCRF